jgi:hypothetical protein
MLYTELLPPFTSPLDTRDRRASFTVSRVSNAPPTFARLASYNLKGSDGWSEASVH